MKRSNTVHEAKLDATHLHDSIRREWDKLMQASDLSLHRSSTINLIAVTEARHLDDLHVEIGHFAARYPCRALVVTYDRDAELAADYRVEIAPGKGTRRMVLERFSFRARVGETDRLASLIRPRLLSELPTIFYVHGPVPTDPATLSLFASHCDLLCFDSSLSGADDARLHELASAFPAQRDLTWFRHAPWRRALAQALEHVTWTPTRATTIRLEHADQPSAAASCRVLAEWLDRRISGSSTTLAIAPDDGSVGPALEPKRLILAHGESVIEICHCCERPRLRTEISLRDHCLVPFEIPASRGSRGALLAAAADRL